MSTYRTLKGYSVKSLTSDPANPNEGQIWYNSATRLIKLAPKIGAWASGGNLNRGSRFGGGLGTQTAMAKFSGPGHEKETEEYNGSSWTNVNDMNTNHFTCASFGTLTAGVAAGGHKSTTPRAIASTEEYDGTNWSSVEDMPAGRQAPQGAGTLTAGIVMGGVLDPPGDRIAGSFEYDGTDWTAGGDMNTARNGNNSAGGTQTAAWIIGGPRSGVNSEEYNGTAWSEGNNIGTARYTCAGCGPQTDAQIAGGSNDNQTSISNKTEFYDGTSWTEGANIGTARYGIHNSPAGSGGLSAIAGGGPGSKQNTEEFTLAVTTRTVDVS
jgi:hypothetical protein